MAIAAVTRINREGKTVKGQRTAADTYRVRVTTDDADINTIRLAVDPSTGLAVPQRGDPYSATDLAMRCAGVTPRIEVPPDARVWLCPADFTTSDVGDENEDPLAEPPKVRWYSNVTSEPVYKDRFGTLIASSAGETFEPPIEKDIYDSVATITRNSSFYDEAIASQYRGKINSTSFRLKGASLPLAAFKGKIIDWTGDEVVKNGVTFWQESLSIQFRSDGWKRNILDQGTRAVDIALGSKTTNKDDLLYPFNGPFPLDGNGKMLALGGSLVFLTKEIDDVIDFNNLNLPQS